MNPTRYITTWTIALACACFTSAPAFAQDPMRDVRLELAALRAEVQELRALFGAVHASFFANSANANSSPRAIWIA
jgi:hypothetical protein